MAAQTYFLVRDVVTNILTILCLFCISFVILLQTPVFYDVYYQAIYGQISEPYALTLDKSTVQQNANAFREYLNDDTQNINLFLTERETLHMEDVKELYLDLKEKAFFAIVTLLCIGLFVFSNPQKHQTSQTKKQKSNSFFSFKKSTAITYLLFFVIIVTQILFFDFFFRFYHTVFFSNDLWLLPANSVTIQTFPQSFFVCFFISTIALTLISDWIFKRIVPRLRQQL